MYDLVGFSYNLLVLQALCIFVIGLSWFNYSVYCRCYV
jgi:hypothetical protein